MSPVYPVSVLVRLCRTFLLSCCFSLTSYPHGPSGPASECPSKRFLMPFAMECTISCLFMFGACGCAVTPSMGTAVAPVSLEADLHFPFSTSFCFICILIHFIQKAELDLPSVGSLSGGHYSWGWFRQSQEPEFHPRPPCRCRGPATWAIFCFPRPLTGS